MVQGRGQRERTGTLVPGAVVWGPPSASFLPASHAPTLCRPNGFYELPDDSEGSGSTAWWRRPLHCLWAGAAAAGACGGRRKAPAVELQIWRGEEVSEARQTFAGWATLTTRYGWPAVLCMLRLLAEQWAAPACPRLRGIAAFSQPAAMLLHCGRRLFRGQAHAELEWTVGPIPFEDGLGREVVLRVRCSSSRWCWSFGASMQGALLPQLLSAPKERCTHHCPPARPTTKQTDSCLAILTAAPSFGATPTAARWCSAPGE